MDKHLNGIISEEQLIARIKSGEIEYVTVTILMFQQIMYKTFEASFFLKHILNDCLKFPQITILFNLDNTPVETDALNFNSENDVPVIVDKSSIRVQSWLGKNYAICMGTMLNDNDNNELCPIYPRNILINTLKRLEEKHGVKFLAASELEFFLFNKVNPEIIKNYPEFDILKYRLSTRESDYAIGTIMTRNEVVLKEIRDNVRDCGVELEQLFTEYAPGQHEINIRYDEALKNCDNHIYLKQCIKHTAYKNGFGCSFMAKIFPDKDGSSCHVHLSVMKEDGTNFFATSGNEEDNHTIELKERQKTIKCHQNMLYFIGGILKYFEDLFLIYAPTINSYKRFKKNSFAPYYINTWCYDSRTASVRVIGNDKTLHLEIRQAGADVNPYLLLSAIFASGMKGVEEKINPPPIILDNAYEKSGEEYVAPPRNIFEAIQLFKKSEFATEVFGKEVKDCLIAISENEWNEYCDHVSNFEIKRYLDLV
jgi:glutamine synthetase